MKLVILKNPSVIKWLTPAGWVTAFLMGVVFLSIGDIKFFLLPLLFFITGSLLSKLNPKPIKEMNGRTAKQVLANGGTALILTPLIIFGHAEIKFTFLFCLVFGICLVDTASSEIGRHFKGVTIDLLTLKKVKPGLSGGISLQGSLFGLLFSVVYGFIAVYLFASLKDIRLPLILFSFLGMWVDSILGSVIQAKYLLNGQIIEEGEQSALVKGFHLIDNDVVNFLSNVLTALLAYVYLTICLGY